MRTPAEVAAQRRYSQSAKGRAAQVRVNKKRDDRVRWEHEEIWRWTCDLRTREGRYPTREEKAAWYVVLHAMRPVAPYRSR